MQQQQKQQSSDNMKASMEIYRCALVLNNMSIALLLRGFLVDALDTMEESLTMLRHAFSLPQKQHDPKEVTNDDTVTNSRMAIMQRASSRFSKASQQAPCSLFLDVTPVDEDDFAGLQSSAKYGPSTTVCFPVRFHQGPIIDSQPSETARQLATVLYNQGLIRFLVATTTNAPDHKEPNNRRKSSNSSKDKLFKSAAKSLQISRMVLAKTDENTGDADGQVRSIFLETMVLNTHCQVYHIKKKTRRGTSETICL